MIRRAVVEASGDVVQAQRAALLSARELGFDDKSAAELAIVASELATNILKYGVRGTLSFIDTVDLERGRALVIAARDHGPPFRDFAAALEDECDGNGPIAPENLFRRHGLGTGLGAVKRFSDRVECIPLTDGKEVRALRYLEKQPRKRGV